MSGHPWILILCQDKKGIPVWYQCTWSPLNGLNSHLHCYENKIKTEYIYFYLSDSKCKATLRKKFSNIQHFVIWAVESWLMRKSRVRSLLWSPTPYWLGRCQYSVTGWDRSHGLPFLSRVWQHVKLWDVSVEAHVRYSLVADEDVK